MRAELYDLAGRRWASQRAVLDAAANAATEAFALDEKPVSRLPLYFVRLVLSSRSGQALSDNFYWQARREEDHRALGALPR